VPIVIHLAAERMIERKTNGGALLIGERFVKGGDERFGRRLFGSRGQCDRQGGGSDEASAGGLEELAAIEWEKRLAAFAIRARGGIHIGLPYASNWEKASPEKVGIF
jgi:hypothetical protein